MYAPEYPFTPKGEDPERAKDESEKFWILDSLHHEGIPYPLQNDHFDASWWARLNQINTNVFCIPTVAGIDHRMLYGQIYLASTPITDPKLIEERAKICQERMGYYFENWEYAGNNFKRKLMETAKTLAEISFQELPIVVDIDDVTSFKGTYCYGEMEVKWRRAIELFRRGLDYHFEILNTSQAAHLALSEFSRAAFPDITLGTISKFVAGVGADIYRPDEEVQKLAMQAMQLGVGEAILGSGDFNAVESRLKTTEAGRRWLESLEQKKYPWFYMTTGSSLPRPSDRYWMDDMEIPLRLLRDYLEMLKKGKNILRDVPGQMAESEKLFNEYRGLLKEEMRPQFDHLRALDKITSPYIEGHGFWFECLHNYQMFRIFRELGGIFENCGLLKEPLDIWYLRYCEIDDMIQDYVRFKTTNPFAGRPLSAYFWNKEIQWRKEVCKRLAEWTPPPVLGVAPAEIQDPMYIGLWGITSERIASWHDAVEIQPEEMSEMKGFPSSPGVAEGVARVLAEITEIDNMERDEILVCRSTAPSWGPLFSRVKAVVTDIGGMMSHAALVARDYGIPAVTGTSNSTMIVKTGDIIRVDGNTGVVTIVEKAT
jgi:pyruvate,water dikinase